MRRIGLITVAGLALLGLAWLTAQRVPVWQSDLALWSAATTTDQPSARAWINLGIAHQSAGKLDLAAGDYQRALGVAETTHDTQGTAIAYLNLATIAGDRGQWQAAQVLLNQARAAQPNLHHAALERDLAAR